MSRLPGSSFLDGPRPTCLGFHSEKPRNRLSLYRLGVCALAASLPRQIYALFLALRMLYGDRYLASDQKLCTAGPASPIGSDIRCNVLDDLVPDEPICVSAPLVVVVRHRMILRRTLGFSLCMAPISDLPPVMTSVSGRAIAAHSSSQYWKGRGGTDSAHGE